MPELPSQRVFFAIPLPETVRVAVAEMQAERLAGARWTWPEQMHLTLRFLGDVEAERVERLARRVREIRVEAFPLPIEGIGVFPPRGRPKVLWAGVGSGHPRLYQLRQRLDDALLAEGVEADLRAFVPHITLARLEGAKPAAVAAYLKRRRLYQGPLFQADRFVLFESRLGPEGARHIPVESFPLAR